jgi:hypothetical protein
LPPPVVTKNELVEIDLQVTTTDPVIRPDQPLLQIADRAVGPWQDRTTAFAYPLGAGDRRRMGSRNDSCGPPGPKVWMVADSDRGASRARVNRVHRSLQREATSLQPGSRAAERSAADSDLVGRSTRDESWADWYAKYIAKCMKQDREE